MLRKVLASPFKAGEKDEYVLAHWEHSQNSSHNHIVAIQLSSNDEFWLWWLMLGIISVIVITVLFIVRQRCCKNEHERIYVDDRIPLSKVVDSRLSPQGIRLYQTDSNGLSKYGSGDRREEEERVHLISGPIEIENGHGNNGSMISTNSRNPMPMIASVADQGQKSRQRPNNTSRSSSYTNSTNGRKTAVTYFSAHHLKDGNDTSLNHAFASVMSAGLVVLLHTSNGPRPINMSMIGDEVRWQAAKQPNGSKVKRYKLNLLDVMFVEVGTQAGHFQDIDAGHSNSKPTRSSSASRSSIRANGGGEMNYHGDDNNIDNSYVEPDHLCFALVTQKTSLFLEAATKVDRDCLVRGFQLRLEGLRN